uniref:(northern house mosquito) hypothetical protein n=1 Tax=Culex pipiens TaxID=7175 RepID=A0A8D8AL63_CULPI
MSPLASSVPRWPDFSDIRPVTSGESSTIITSSPDDKIVLRDCPYRRRSSSDPDRGSSLLTSSFSLNSIVGRRWFCLTAGSATDSLTSSLTNTVPRVFGAEGSSTGLAIDTSSDCTIVLRGSRTSTSSIRVCSTTSPE